MMSEREAPERTGRRRGALFAVLALIAAAAAAAVFFLMNRGAEYEDADDLRAALEAAGYPCEAVAPPSDQPGRSLQLCELREPAGMRLGLRVYESEDANEAALQAARENPPAAVGAGNWQIVFPGSDLSLWEDIAEALDGEVYAPPVGP